MAAVCLCPVASSQQYFVRDLVANKKCQALTFFGVMRVSSISTLLFLIPNTSSTSPIHISPDIMLAWSGKRGKREGTLVGEWSAHRGDEIHGAINEDE